MHELNLKQAVQKFCKECNGEYSPELNNWSLTGKPYDCMHHDCLLYPWKIAKGKYEEGVIPLESHINWLEKHGTGVKKTRIVKPYSEERKAKMAETLKKYRESRYTD